MDADACQPTDSRLLRILIRPFFQVSVHSMLVFKVQIFTKICARATTSTDFQNQQGFSATQSVDRQLLPHQLEEIGIEKGVNHSLGKHVRVTSEHLLMHLLTETRT